MVLAVVEGLGRLGIGYTLVGSFLKQRCLSVCLARQPDLRYAHATIETRSLKQANHAKLR